MDSRSAAHCAAMIVQNRRSRHSVFRVQYNLTGTMCYKETESKRWKMKRRIVETDTLSAEVKVEVSLLCPVISYAAPHTSIN